VSVGPPPPPPIFIPPHAIEASARAIVYLLGVAPGWVLIALAVSIYIYLMRRGCS
jgi:hypothetical protein